MAVSEKIKSIIAEQLGVKAEEVTPQASFIDDLGADSLDTVELIMALEEEFNELLQLNEKPANPNYFRKS